MRSCSNTYKKVSYDINRYAALFTADFETSTPKWNVDKARVWLWDICNEKLEHKNGITLNSFMVEISNYKNSLIGFRNLSFDGYYILNFLLENGFEFREELNGEYCTFTTLITDLGQHYTYRIIFDNGNIVTIFDTFKHCHQSIKMTAETYKLPIEKGKIDYDEYREENHTPTEEELLYIHNDTEIDMRHLLIDIEMGMSKITQTGNCKHLLKKSIKDYDLLFPVLESGIDAYCRKAYRGGFTYLEPKFFNKDLRHMISLDINSMYPAQMLHRKMPYGEPLFEQGKYDKNKFPKGYDLYIQHFECSFWLKENGIPMISKRSFGITSNELYFIDSGENIMELWLSSPDTELFFDNYDVEDVNFIDCCAFKSICGYEVTPSEVKRYGKMKSIEVDGKGSIFYDYLLPLRIKKETCEGAERDNAKRMQNIVYGAFATNSKGGLYAPYLDSDGLLRYTRYMGSERKLMYIPVSIFVTAWSRYFLINSIKKVRDRFVYCDTDSLYLLGDEIPDLNIHASLYGYFKVEHHILKARFLGAKRYIYFANTDKDSRIKKTVVCCGATDDVRKRMNFANFRPNATFDGKLANKTVKGGKHLTETTYKLKCGG